MGSFWGHLTQGLFTFLIALWWLCNMFVDYRQSLRTGEHFRSRISYVSTIRNKRLPLEIYMKILVMAANIFLDIFGPGLPVSFIDENNRFSGLHHLQHITLYGLFFIQSVTDLLSYRQLSPIMTVMNYLTMALAFFWHGVQFYYHSEASTHKEPLENTMHRMPLPIIFLIALMFVWEMRQREIIFPQIVRSLGVLIMGTWFCQMSFILYLPAPFPGNLPNPAWNQTDVQNIHFMSGLFGFHIIFSVFVVFLVFSLVKLQGELVGGAKVMKRNGNRNHLYEYHKLNRIGPIGPCDDSEEKTSLLANVEEYCD